MRLFGRWHVALFREPRDGATHGLGMPTMAATNYGDSALRDARNAEERAYRESERWYHSPIVQRRAEALLRANLDETQLAEFDAADAFAVTGSLGHRYRIRRGSNQNVDMLDPETGAIIRNLCAGPIGQMPVADIMLAQKLLLEADELAFAFVANVWIVTQAPQGTQTSPGATPERYYGLEDSGVIRSR